MANAGFRCALLAVIVLGSCSQGRHARFPQRPCAESQRARAAGTYAKADSAAAERAFGSYSASCQKGCARDGFYAALPKDDAQCVELDLLAAVAEPPGEASYWPVGRLIGFCSAGFPQACDWIAAHPERRQIWDDFQEYLATRPPEEPAGGDEATPEDDTVVGRAVRRMTADLAAEGFSLQSDTEVSLETGYASFKVWLQPSFESLVVLVGNSTTTFTASIGGGGTENSFDFGVEDINPAVFVMSVQVALAAFSHARPSVFIRDAGGDRGTVRGLRFDRMR